MIISKDIVEKATEESVLIVPRKATEMLQEAIERRVKEVEAIQKELDGIKISLQSHTDTHIDVNAL